MPDQRQRFGTRFGGAFGVVVGNFPNAIAAIVDPAIAAFHIEGRACFVGASGEDTRISFAVLGSVGSSNYTVDNRQ